MRKQTRGQRNAQWIERYCLVPSGPQRGEHVKLTQVQRNIVLKLYSSTDNVEPITGHLASCITLLHLCGVEHASPLPLIEADVFSVWSATGEKLREVLRRDGETITCPELGTMFPGPRRAA